MRRARRWQRREEAADEEEDGVEKEEEEMEEGEGEVVEEVEEVDGGSSRSHAWRQLPLSREIVMAMDEMFASEDDEPA